MTSSITSHDWSQRPGALGGAIQRALQSLRTVSGTHPISMFYNLQLLASCLAEADVNVSVKSKRSILSAIYSLGRSGEYLFVYVEKYYSYTFLIISVSRQK